MPIFPSFTNDAGRDVVAACYLTVSLYLVIISMMTSVSAVPMTFVVISISASITREIN